MAHMSIFPGNHEIVEIEEEELTNGENHRLNNFMKPDTRREEKDRSLASYDGNVTSLEEDLNQLFEIFNRKASSQKSSHQNQSGTGSSKRNASKKPAKAGGSHSQGHGISERMNLKQALRGLCLSQASEMAAIKRSTKSPQFSESGRITTMYRNVVVQDIISDHSQYGSGEGLLEISLVPEQTTLDSSQSVPGKFAESDLWPSNRSSLTEKVNGPTKMANVRSLDSKDSNNQTSMVEKPAHVTSLSFSRADFNNSNMDHSSLTQNPANGSHISPSPSSPSANSIREVRKSSTRENGKSFSFVGYESQTSLMLSQTGKHTSPTSSSRSSYDRKSPAQKDLVASVGKEGGYHKSKLDMESNSYGQRISDDIHDKTSLDISRKMAEQKEVICKSPMAKNQKQIDMAYKEEYTHTRSPRRSDLGDKVLDRSMNSGSPCKVVSKETTAKSAKVVAKDKDIVLPENYKTVTSTSSPNGKKVSKSTKNAQHLVKPLIKTRNFVKRRTKKKMAADNGSKNIRCEFNNDLYSSPNPIVCPRCQCDVTDVWKESSKEPSLSHQDSPISPQESPVSPFTSLSDEISSGNVISDFSAPGPSSETILVDVSTKSMSMSKSTDKGEISQSSKSSPGECSSSTNISVDIKMGRPSFCDRPHMSKDVRWEAIRQVRFQHGTLGLKNFSLVKKLGCGDIGTVYLAELIGTNCLFAIKVMDCEFLVRRKKISRAQTEKDILRMLDHPFLPTLYCQFVSDNLSCLVMEYCPGGDLHVLRQRQPGRFFTEQAARFYVAEVLLALEYLHMLGVIYRDLKPENILVREDGHIMLSDFDLSLRCAVSPTLLVSSSMSDGLKKLSRDSRPDARCAQPLCIEPSCKMTCFTPKLLSNSSKSRKLKSDMAAEMRPLLQLVAEPTTARSNSFVGTHEYLAPEIIKGEGHGSAVDWWTFGVFLYELLYGRTPFKGPGNEETLANVILQNLKFPDSPLVSLQARDLIDALLVKEPENRLGTERGAAEIKQHPFFDGLNWALIRCAVPPELPETHNYGGPKPVSNEKNNKSTEFSSGSSSAELLEFEVF